MRGGEHRPRRPGRRSVLLGGAAVALAGTFWMVGTLRRLHCHLVAPTHAGDTGSGGVTGSENIFLDPPFAECHASTLALAGEALVCAWFGGSREGRPDVGIWASTRGRTGWSAPRLVVRGASDSGEALPCWNPVLWHSPGGILHLFYKVGRSPRSWRGMLMRSNDGGQNWSLPVRLPEGILGPIKNKPVLLADGRLLCPSSTEHDGWRVHFEWTTDEGRSWNRTAPLGDGRSLEIIQPTLLVHPSARLQALCRSRQGRIAELWSGDGGRTWSAPRPTALPNPNSGLDAVTLADGRHLLVHNPLPRCRSPLVVSLSHDGRVWREVARLESGRGEFSYPAVVQQPDGLVRISYTNRRETIGHVTMDPQAI